MLFLMQFLHKVQQTMEILDLLHRRRSNKNLVKLRPLRSKLKI
ncbi:Uncharacterised protein [Actinobacillus equuli]|nr:Uncharacterised protein [Actinobacillus equuli]